MLLPAGFQDLLSSKRFWTDYFFITDPEDDVRSPHENWNIDLTVAEGFSLGLHIQKGFYLVQLDLDSPNVSQKIAWDDQAHFHPHVLRWVELDLICRAIAARDPEQPHPGIPLLLLHRFAPICLDDDLDTILPMLYSAFRKLGFFADREIQGFMERVDARDAGFRWQYESSPDAWFLRQDGYSGWCLKPDAEATSGKGVYTLRGDSGTGFPSNEWKLLLAAAERTIVEAYGKMPKADPDEGEHASAPQALEGRMIDLRRKHGFNMEISLEDDQYPLPSAAIRVFSLSASHILSDLNIGAVKQSGCAYKTVDGVYFTTSWFLFITFYGDVERGMQLLRDAMWWFRMPNPHRARDAKQQSIPFNLAQEAFHPPELCMELGSLTSYHGDSSNGTEKYRIDRRPFSAATEQALRTALADARAEGPDANGWYTVALPDGGVLDACLFTKIDTDGLNSCTIAIRKLSQDTVNLVYKLLSDGELILLPMAIATSQAVTQSVGAPYPNTHLVESAAELYEILAAGPYEWWLRHGQEVAQQ